MSKKITWQQVFAYLLVFCSVIGLIASFVLIMEKIHILSDPSYSPSCNINPVLSCTSVSGTPQGSVFNFPDQFIGLIGFSIILAIGMALIAGAKFKRWFWLGLQTGITFGFLFMLWLMYQSIYVIGALCIYCMVTWSIMLPLAWYITLNNIENGSLVLGKKLNTLSVFAKIHHLDILVCAYLIVIALILNHFWYYWNTLI